MIYIILLTLHIAGALGLFILFGISLFILLQRHSNKYKSIISGILIINLSQVSTGTLLFINQNNTMSVTGFCARLGPYVILSILFCSVIYIKMKIEEKNSILLDKERKV
jgi:uncharacterized membrane protein